MFGAPVVANATAGDAGVDVGFDAVVLPADEARVPLRESLRGEILQLRELVACGQLLSRLFFNVGRLGELRGQQNLAGLNGYVPYLPRRS